MPNLLRIAELGLEAWSMAARAAKSGAKPDIIVAAFAVLGRAFDKAQTGAISIDDLESEVEKLRSSLATEIAAQNASVDDRLAEKFGVKKDG